MKFIVNLWLDGYETEEEMETACLEFIREQLDMAASSVKVTRYEAELSQTEEPGTGSTSYVCWNVTDDNHSVA